MAKKNTLFTAPPYVVEQTLKQLSVQQALKSNFMIVKMSG